MSEISLGLKWYPKKRRFGKVYRDRIIYDKNRHVLCFGPTGSGKGVGLEIGNLLRLKGLSIISIDPKGQNEAVTARWRSTVSEVVRLNPLNLFGHGSTGFNPLAALDPASPDFFQHASMIAEALIRMPEKGDPFFDISARNLTLGLVMWEVKSAREEGRAPLLKNVRIAITGDLPKIAKEIEQSGDFQLISLLGQFKEKNKTNDGIVATAASQTQWLLAQPMLDDLEKDGIDFARLKQKATTVYVMLPAHALETFSAWLRLVVACAFNALYRHEGGGGLRTLFLLSEFAQLGNLSMVKAALAQGRGYGIQLFPVLQDINQLRAIYGKDEAHTFIGMSGATFGFTPNDSETAEWMSKRSGEIYVPVATESEDQQTGARGTSIRPEKRRAYSPDDLHDIPEFHGLVWFAGQSAAQPVYAPPYWDAQHNADLVGRYDPDPYHTGQAAAGTTARKKNGAGVYFTLAALAVGLWFWQHAKPAPRAVLVSPPAPALHHAKHHHAPAPAKPGDGDLIATAH
jgi:type IV secretion system protein VirD4